MPDPFLTSPFATAWSTLRSRFVCRLRRRRADSGWPHRCRQLAVSILLPLPGCAFPPSINILGSFFPAWLVCIVIGIVLTILTQRLLVAAKISSHLGPAALVYPSLAALWIFATWLLLFES